jgi:hypothetical protein
MLVILGFEDTGVAAAAVACHRRPVVLRWERYAGEDLRQWYDGRATRLQQRAADWEGIDMLMGWVVGIGMLKVGLN